MKKVNAGCISKNKDEFFQELQKMNKFNDYEQKMLKNIENGVNFEQMYRLMQVHKNADYLLVDPILRKTKENTIKTNNQSDQFSQTVFCKMKSLPNLFNSTMKTSDKRAPFDPISLLNVGKSTLIQTNVKQDSINLILPDRVLGGTHLLLLIQCIQTRKPKLCRLYKTNLLSKRLDTLTNLIK